MTDKITVIKITAHGKDYHFEKSEWIDQGRLPGFLKANKPTITKGSITDIDHILMTEEEFNELKQNESKVLQAGAI